MINENEETPTNKAEKKFWQNIAERWDDFKFMNKSSNKRKNCKFYQTLPGIVKPRLFGKKFMCYLPLYSRGYSLLLTLSPVGQLKKPL